MTGYAFSLGSALLWAIAAILFKKAGNVFSPISLNIYKSIVAMILIGLTMLALGIPFFPPAPWRDIGLLLLSGVLGITLADIFFFTALIRLRAGLVAVIECFYLPSVLFFSYLLLGERLGLGGIVGGCLVLMAIVVGAGLGRAETFGQADRTLEKGELFGVFAGILSMALMALGIVMVKDVLERSDVFWATFVRLVAGLISLLALVMCLPRKNQYFRELKWSKGWWTALPASVTGNFLALLCWVAGMKYTSASKAAILNQMSTIFLFILASVWLREKITGQRIIAIILAVSGAYLTILYG